MQRLSVVSRMRMIGTTETTWTSEADELASPSCYKYKYVWDVHLLAPGNAGQKMRTNAADAAGIHACEKRNWQNYNDTFTNLFLEISSFGLDKTQCCIESLKASTDLIDGHYRLRDVLHQQQTEPSLRLIVYTRLSNLLMPFWYVCKHRTLQRCRYITYVFNCLSASVCLAVL